MSIDQLVPSYAVPLEGICAFVLAQLIAKRSMPDGLRGVSGVDDFLCAAKDLEAITVRL
jgi:hypothetical protein